MYLRLLNAVAYILDRASEASTWAGITMIVGPSGLAMMGIDPHSAVLIGVALAGFIHAVFPDVKDTRHAE